MKIVGNCSACGVSIEVDTENAQVVGTAVILDKLAGMLHIRDHEEYHRQWAAGSPNLSEVEGQTDSTDQYGIVSIRERMEAEALAVLREHFPDQNAEPSSMPESLPEFGGDPDESTFGTLIETAVDIHGRPTREYVSRDGRLILVTERKVAGKPKSENDS